MIAIRQKVVRDHGLTRVEYLAARKEAWEAAGQLWHTEILPSHFEEGAQQRYGYTARKRFYRDKKRRLFGHGRPLVFTGTLRRQVLRSSRIKSVGVSRKNGGVKVRVFGPRYLRQYRRDGRQPDKASELGSVTREEARRMEKLMERLLTERMNRGGRREEIR